MRMNVYLCQLDWAMIFASCSTTQHMWDAFLTIVRSTIETYVPTSVARDKGTCTHTQEVCRQIQKQRKLHAVYKQSGSASDRERWKEANKQTRVSIRHSALAAEQRLLESACDKKFWSFVTSRLKCSNRIPAIQTERGLLTDSGSKAEALNQQFSSVFISDDGADLGFNDRTAVPDRLSVHEIDEIEVFATLRHLQNKFSCGPDELPQFVLKRLAISLAHPLSLIFNFSLATSSLPADWTCANITPVFKKGLASEASNYRPISITSTVCRAFEKILKSKIVTFLMLNGILSQEQHGFLSRHSTVTQLLECLSDWNTSLDSSKPVDVAYMDIAKAFDSVSHEKLFQKLQYYGISGRLLGWLKAWLTGRRQRVRVEESYSSYNNVTSGVPQGSVLGPLLFLIYINDLPQVVRHCKMKLFADDCKLYLCVRSIEDAGLLQEDLQEVWGWCNRHQLVLALMKCSVLHLGPRNNPCLDYSIGGTALPTSSCIRDLGILISQDLRFTEHCNNIAQSAGVKLNMIFNCFVNRNSQFLSQMYKTFVRSKLEYASSTWNPTMLRNIDTLESVQRRFTKRLYGMGSLSYTERLIALNLEPLELRRLKADLILVYKIIHRLVSLNFDDFFKYARSAVTRGHAFKLEIPLCATNYGKFFFSYRVVSAWNSLSAATVTSRTISTFKIRLNSENLTNFLKGRL